MHTRSLGIAVIFAAIANMGSAEDMPSLRVAVLEFGTVNWEMDTIQHHGLDEENGLSIDVKGLAGSAATQVAFQGGEADALVTDWLWVARQRAEGKDYVFVPYSKAVGGIMVPEGSDAETLADLAGEKIGIAGGPLDKSWLILTAYAAEAFDFDLPAETEQVFGAPPLIFKTATSGELDAAVNFWHFMAKMDAAGMRTLMTVADAAEALGLDPETPLLGYAFHGEMLRENPEIVHGFAAASRAAKGILAENDAEWDRLRPRMRVQNDAEFEALKAGFRAGIPSTITVDEAAADRMLQLMAEIGGPDLVGDVETLPEGIFVQPPS